MINKLNRKPAPVSAERIDEWEQKFNQLCYQVFHCYAPGKELLEHMERKHFRSPVANPSIDAPWAYFNEGRNDHIRSYTNAIQKHLRQPKSKEKIREEIRKAYKPLNKLINR